jgi:ribosomal protein S12 methylthiotransferase
MRENPKICKYLDMPLQHIANPVLKNMMRHVTREETEALIKRIKEEVPGVSIRTTFLVGFPGETEADFEELKEFVEEMKFERLGVFPFSNEEGTYAYKHFKDKLSDEEKQERADEIMEIQQQISAELNQEKIGKTFKVIIDRIEGEFYIGRTEFDSPEVDGEVLVTSARPLQKGEFVQVKITGAEDYDLFGVVV